MDREVELAQLKRLADAVTSGDGATALILGEPGVGKTRLADELVRAQDDRFRVIRGSARVVGEQPLGVLIEAVESQLGALPDGPDKEIVTAALHDGGTLPRLRADPGARARGRSRRAAPAGGARRHRVR